MNRATRWSRGVMGSAVAALLLTTLVRPAPAASFVNRGLTLPRGTFELGLGLGLGHRDPIDYTGFGVNLELGYGFSQALELRFRTGLRFGTQGRVTQADYFGRPVETETRNLGGDTVANPEISLRLRLVDGRTADLALDTRMYIPLDGDFGFMFGVPLALHLGSRVRLDTGIHVLFVLENDRRVDVSLPLHLWIRLEGGTFFGPMTGMYFHDGGGESVPFGLGAGTALAHDADLRFWLLFTNINQDGRLRHFGAGAGLYVTF